jgi:hypothetical protein
MADSILTNMEANLNYEKVEPELYYRLSPTSDDILTRRNVSVAPSSGGGTLNGGDSTAIRFKIRSGDFIDAHSVYMTLDYQQSATNKDANRAETANGAGLLFKEIRILSGTGVVIERIRRCDILQNVLQNFSLSKNNVDTVLRIGGGGAGYKLEADGTTHTNDRMGNTANQDNKVAFHLPSGFLHSCGKFLDCGALKSLVIELELNDNATFLKGVGTVTAPTFTVSNPQLHYDEIRVSGEYLRAYQMSLINGLNIGYSTYTHSSSIGGSSVRISKSVSRLKDIISVVVPNAQQSATADSIDTYKAQTDAMRWNYSIGSENFPVSEIQSVAQSYYSALKVMARNKDSYCGYVTYPEFVASKGILAVDCELNQGSAFSGVKTTGNPDILLLSSGDVSTSTDTVHSFLHHERILRFSNGSVEVLE